MTAIGIEFLSVFGLPPVEFVNLTADLGCHYFSCVLVGLSVPDLGYPPYSLRDDARLRADTLAAMDNRGVEPSLGEGLLIAQGTDVSSLASDLDVLAELRVPRVNTVSMDPDRNRTLDQLAELAALAGERGMATTIEFAPGLVVGDLATAVAAVQHVGRPDVGILVDTMHLARTGGTAAELAAVDPALIGYAQLSDTTVAPRFDSYMEEAMFERMVPGEGELPLRDIVAALPDHVIVGLEIPMRSLAEKGVSPFDRLRPCVEAARRLSGLRG